MRHLVTGVLCATVIASFAFADTAKKIPPSTDGSDPNTWDPKTFAPLAAPENHKVIYENDNIRVMSVTVPHGTPGHPYQEPYHAHPYYSILIVDKGAKIFDRDVNGKEAPDPMIDVIQKPFAFIQPPQALHSIENRDTFDAHLIRVEFKKAVPIFLHADWEKDISKMPISTDGTDPKTWDPKTAAPVAAPDLHKVIYDADNIRIMSVTVPVGAEEPYHNHPYPSLLIFDSTAKAADRDRDGKSDDATLPPAPLAFLQPPQGFHSVKNLDKVPVHLIRVEFKKGFGG